MLSRKQTKKGFTLIELLVVIAIIGLLLAIILPALRVARESGRSMVCRTNLKNLLMAWLLYKDENSDKLVAGMLTTAADSSPWVFEPPAGASSTVEEEQEYIKKGYLWPYIQLMETYRCPSDRRNESKYYENAYRTYSIPGGMNGVHPTKGGWEILPHVKYSEIRSPANKFVFIPEIEIERNNGAWVMYPRSELWIDWFAIWHRKYSTNLGWADGHVEMYRWHSVTLIKWFERVLNNPEGLPYTRDPRSGDEEEMNDFQYVRQSYAYKAFFP